MPEQRVFQHFRPEETLGVGACISTKSFTRVRFSAASAKPAMAAVSERLPELERAIAACLIQRTARKHALTEGAELFVCYSPAARERK